MAAAHVKKYREACASYGVPPCSSIVTWLRFEDASGVRISPPRHHRCIRTTSLFRDLDLQPFVDVLQDDGQLLARLRRLDLAHAKLGPCCGRLLAHVLQLPGCRLECLELPRQRLGKSGAAALLRGALRCPSLHTLSLKSCRFGDAEDAIVELLRGVADTPGHALRELDLRNNLFGFYTCRSIEVAAKGSRVKVNLDGNKVVDEVLNAVSHGLGLVLAIIGTVYLARAVRKSPPTHILSVVLYCIALNVLYLASTLYHSMKGLPAVVVRVFHTLDNCAIFLLIAGSYCPFLWILFPGEAHAERLLLFLWSAAVGGILLMAFYDGPGKAWLNTSLCLLMGWSCTSCLTELLDRLGPHGGQLLFLGGCCYTGGVPFFVKNGRTLGMPDHTLWHLFVLAGSVSHYFTVLWYVVPSK